jgi:hypothetical protein
MFTSAQHHTEYDSFVQAPDEGMRPTFILEVEEREAWLAFQAAKQEHDRARREYVSRFSWLQRAFQAFGSRTKAYKTTQILPLKAKTDTAYQLWLLTVDVLETEWTFEPPLAVQVAKIWRNGVASGGASPF